MKVPSFERYADWLSGMGLFVAGMVVGAAVFLGIFQHNLSVLHEQIGALSNQNKTLSDSIENLNKFKKNQQYIGKVDVIVELGLKDKDKTDVNVLNEIKRRVYNDIKQVSGKPVSAVKEAPDIFTDLVDRKVYRFVYDKDYIVHVRRLVVVQTDYILYISYEEHSPLPE